MFKLNQKVKLIIPRENDKPAIFEGYQIAEINDMSKNISIKKDGKVFLHIYFWLDGSSKKKQGSTLTCKIVPTEEAAEGDVLKDAEKEIQRQYDIYVSRRQDESKKRKDARDAKEKEKAELKAKFGE
jgi:hypothetical protein